MNFGIIGVAGYIAVRHLRAIKDTGNTLIASVDPHDSVGLLDNYFPNAAFFSEIERFDRHLEKLRRYSPENKIDYVSICSPNFLHDSHIRLALRLDADAICEKPLVIKPSNFDMLYDLEQETGRKIHTILQLRVHPTIIKLKEELQSLPKNKRHEVELTYITSRGAWYKYSWKGNMEKSGGLATNIGIHFFDMLMWIFGKEKHCEVYLREEEKMSGFIELENANVKWFLSIDRDDLPESAINAHKSTFRSIKVDGEEIEFTDGFTDLHTIVYQNTLNGNGFGLDDAYPTIDLVNKINYVERSKDLINPHPFLKKKKSFL